MAEETAARLKKIGNEGVDVVLTAEDMGRDVRVSPVGKQSELDGGRPNYIHAAIGEHSLALWSQRLGFTADSR